MGSVTASQNSGGGGAIAPLNGVRQARGSSPGTGDHMHTSDNGTEPLQHQHQHQRYHQR